MWGGMSLVCGFSGQCCHPSSKVKVGHDCRACCITEQPNNIISVAASYWQREFHRKRGNPILKAEVELM